LEKEQVPFIIDDAIKEVYLSVFIVKKNDDEVLGRSTINFVSGEKRKLLNLIKIIMFFAFYQLKGEILTEYFTVSSVNYSLNQSDKKTIDKLLPCGKVLTSTSICVDMKLYENIITQKDYDNKSSQAEEEYDKEVM
jgi:hypothetical protein